MGSFLGSIKQAALETALEIAWPTRCISCDKPGALICANCKGVMHWIEQRWACPVCGAPYGWATCTECRNDWELRACISACIFGDTSARLISAYKDEGEHRLADNLAACIAGALFEAKEYLTAQKPARNQTLQGTLRIKALRTRHRGEERFMPSMVDAICFLPATEEAYRRRGFDHMEKVAHSLSLLLGIPVVDALMRTKAKDQRLLNRGERLQNSAGTFTVVEDVAGAHVLLVDDVITSGASIREAARALLMRGAVSITGASVCRTW